MAAEASGLVVASYLEGNQPRLLRLAQPVAAELPLTVAELHLAVVENVAAEPAAAVVADEVEFAASEVASAGLPGPAEAVCLKLLNLRG